MNFTCRYFALRLLGAAAFRLLDVGAPRTGTQSMYTAMKILGLKPLHSGYQQDSRDALCGYLFGDSVANRSLDDALATLDGFDAAMDEPFMLFYEEVMAAFPDAKFLLTPSDAESWYQNAVEVVGRSDPSIAAGRPSYWFECTAERSWGCKFHLPGVGKAECLQNYNKHIDRVQEVIPPEKLLVYNWSDGWAPLVHFLGLPVPEEDFPHVDEVRDTLDARDWLTDIFAR